MSDLKRKQVVYYTRILPSHGIYDVYDLTVRTVEDTWFVGIDKRDKHAFLFNDSDINKIVFLNRNDAVEKAIEAESNRKDVNNETYYEEY